MQFLSSKTLLYIRCILLFVVCYIVVSSPETILGSGFVLLLGEAMQLPIVAVQDTNPLLPIVSIVYGLLSLSDLIPLIADNIDYFETIVPTRLLIFFGLGSYAYLVDSVLSNNVVFVYSFLEIWLNFLIYNNLRDEKYRKLKKYIEENADSLRMEEKVTVIED